MQTVKPRHISIIGLNILDRSALVKDMFKVCYLALRPLDYDFK
jgi:hypothetical protein